MTTAQALTKIGEEITQILKEYDNSPASKDSLGVRIPHVLDTVTDAEKLIAINKGLLAAAMTCRPKDLWRDTGVDIDPKLYDINSTKYVAVPATATNTGEDLDIDEALAYGVVYYAVLMLYSGNDRYSQKAETLFKNYNSVQKQYDLAVAQGN